MRLDKHALHPVADDLETAGSSLREGESYAPLLLSVAEEMDRTSRAQAVRHFVLVEEESGEEKGTVSRHGPQACR